MSPVLCDHHPLFYLLRCYRGSQRMEGKPSLLKKKKCFQIYLTEILLPLSVPSWLPSSSTLIFYLLWSAWQQWKMDNRWEHGHLPDCDFKHGEKNYFLQCLKTLSPLFPKLPSYIWLLFKSFFLNISPEIVPTSVKCSPFNFSNDITNYIDLTGLLFYWVCKNKRSRANSVNFNKNINRWWFTQVTCPKNSFDHPSFICL